MPALTRERANEFIGLLRTIPEDKKPEWGKMNRAQLYGHLMIVLRYCMRQVPEFPDSSTLYRRLFLKPLLLNGFVDFPKSVPLPDTVEGTRPEFPEATLEEFEQALEEYFGAVQEGALDPPPHPYFGYIGVDGWSKFHVQHMKHHLRQFGAM